MSFSIKNLKISIKILLICFVGQLYAANCPADIQPCHCTNKSQIICSGDQKFDLKSVFSKIGDSGIRHFQDLILTNSAFTELEDNVFGSVSFTNIAITGAYGLTKVSKWALNASAFTLEEFKQTGENHLTDDNVDSLFDALSSLVIVNRVFLELTKVTKIPDNAFKIINGRQTRLESIHMNFIGGKYGSLQSVGNKAFYYLDNLNYISLANQPLKLLKAQSFDFEKSSDQDLDLHLEATKVTGSSFEAGIFLNAKRAITIEMSNNAIEYFDEKVFKPVFDLPKAHEVTIIVENNPLSCADCRMEWMVKDKANLDTKVMGVDCMDGQHTLWDMKDTDFAKCHHI